MGNTRDLFKKIRDTNGIISCKDGHNIGKKEAEDIKKKWQEYTEELYKKILMTQITEMDDHSSRARHPGVWSQVGLR